MSASPPGPASQPTVLVTGGASGIGLATARAVRALGWQVVIADIELAHLDHAREALRGAGPAVAYERLDVTDEDAVVRLVARCGAEIGPLTGVVNSAGIANDIYCLDIPTPLFRRTLEVNLIGSFVVAREAARVMSRRGRGSIVNIASVSGLRGNTGRAAYGASKAGVIAMTWVMAMELAPAGVRVNAVAPGGIETPLTGALHTPEFRAEWARRTPQHRYGAPEDVAAAVVFLLDDRQSAFVTGQTFCVDGGFSTAGLMRGEEQEHAMMEGNPRPGRSADDSQH